MSIPEEMPAGEMPTGEKPAEDKKKKWVIGAACLAAVGVSALTIIRQIPPSAPAVDPATYRAMVAAGSGPPAGAPGAGAPGGQRAPGTRGQITTLSATSITVQGRDGVPKTFTVTPATKITVDQKPASAAALKMGLRARIVSKDEKSADEIVIRTRPPGGRGGPGGGPGGGGPGGGGPGAARP